MADHPLGPYRDEWDYEGQAVLEGFPKLILGPGYCSVTKAIDDQIEILVYHAWDAEGTARRICIDPLAWLPHPTYDHPKCLGPTFEPQSMELGS